jgi:hypothetical protein
MLKLCANNPMSAMGQKRTRRSLVAMSALTPKADIGRREWHVGLMPQADIALRFVAAKITLDPNQCENQNLSEIQ